jgi:DNA-binding MarR family transcriptional regulator
MEIDGTGHGTRRREGAIPPRAGAGVLGVDLTDALVAGEWVTRNEGCDCRECEQSWDVWWGGHGALRGSERMTGWGRGIVARWRRVTLVLHYIMYNSICQHEIIDNQMVRYTIHRETKNISRPKAATKQARYLAGSGTQRAEQRGRCDVPTTLVMPTATGCISATARTIRPKKREAVLKLKGAATIEPSEALCSDLCAAGRAIARGYRPLLSSLGLTYPQYLVLVALGQREPRTVGELGDRLALDSGTLSPLLKRLEASGLLTRDRRRDDERAVDVALTSKGVALLREAATVPAKMAAAVGLSPRAVRRFRVLIQELMNSLAREDVARAVSLAT